MFLVLTVAALLALTAGQDAGCCTPSQWEGNEATLIGYTRSSFFKSLGKFDADCGLECSRSGLMKSFSRVSYNADNQTIAVNVSITRDGSFHTAKLIQNFAEHKQYLITQADKCYEFDLKGDFKKACIPENATLSSSFYFGVGNASLSAKSFEVKVRTKNTEATAFVTISEQCIPISEAIYGSSTYRIRHKWLPVKVEFLETVGFIDITGGISDPSVFTPPGNCTKPANLAMTELFDQGDKEKHELKFQPQDDKLDPDIADLLLNRDYGVMSF